MTLYSFIRNLKLSPQLWFALVLFPTFLLLTWFGLISYKEGILITEHGNWLMLTSILCLIFYIGIAAFYIKKITNRLSNTKKAIQALSAGDFNQTLQPEGNNELADIEIAVNTIANQLAQASHFTENIGNGNSDAVFTPVGQSDILGHSLLKMRDNLASMKREELKRNWATEGLAKFVEILRMHENIKDLSNEIVKNLVQTLNATQGALFLLNTEKSQEPILEMTGCYAYKRTKHLTHEIAVGQGLVGQTYLEKETLYLKEIPEDFVRITSGLGDANPRNILLVPLKVNNDTIGIVELASFHEFEKHEIAFVEKLGENIAHTVIAFRINQHTKVLLKESQEQAERMRSQEEELRQNQEELQATQEEISRRYNSLFQQLHELNYQSRFEQLRSITSTKKRNIEYYFDIIRSQIQTFAENKMLISAVKEFKSAFYDIQKTVSDAELEQMKRSVKGYYIDEFIPRLNDNTSQQAFAGEYLPDQKTALILQYHYISNNTHPTGQKSLLDNVGDNSEYSRIHAHYHPVMRSFLEKFGYYDIFLIDPETGDMLYSVFKEVDFATSLTTGLYHTTNFGTVVKEAVQSTDRNFVKLIDFEPYDPSYKAPASFIACPVYDNDQKVGILVFQMPINKINQILTGDNKWREDGLGDSGETFIVGSDYKLRSIVRELIENEAEHLASLRKAGYSDTLIRQIQKSNTSILLEEMKLDSVTQALQGKTGTQIETNLQHEKMLNAYAPLEILDVNWMIMSTMKEEEASMRINRLKENNI
ncbi:GAF domain-containing protein [Xanthocytophaga agilis]|uniref:GAF domain-containing protein n=1 Tax=Xanthocytophaga agilis TaxID=3048010 RepID=A0AAE3RD38_9BACT|nr:GAF domain-containing protein [Xanthocytophaga agilis]MDJ1506382.1 GAF domain-containing protein [Xanthocytophaga agilis]